MTRLSVGLVDPVGAKAGMDCYDLFLLRALYAKGVNSFLISNFNTNGEVIQVKNFFHNRGQSGILSYLKSVCGIPFSMFYLKKQRCRWVIFHVFRGDFLELFSSMMAKFFNFRVLLIVHDIESLDTGNSKVIQRLVLEKFHDIKVVHNTFSCDELKKIVAKKSVRNIRVIRHGNFIPLFGSIEDRTASCRMFGLSPEKKYLLFFGQIKRIKGLDLLLTALPHCKSCFDLIIAGKLRNDSWDYYQKIIDRLNLSGQVIPFIRHISDHERACLLSVAEAVVLPYRLIYQSGVLLMAMSFGQVVIASDLAPFKEIIRSGQNGFLFEGGNASDLAQKLDDLFMGVADKKQISNSALTTMQAEYSWHDIAQEYAEILH